MENKQEYPNVTLVIKNGVPVIELRKSKTEVQQMLTGENIDDFLKTISDKIGYQGSSSDALSLASESDELYLNFPVVEDEKPEKISFAPIVEVVNQEVEDHNRYAHGSQELRNQMHTYWQGDVLASVLEEIYNILIVDTVHAASELGIGAIQLEENTGHDRLKHKMSLELQKLDVPLILL